MNLRARTVVAVRHLLNRLGLDLVRALDDSDLLRRRLQLLTGRDVDVVFDVGAGSGQYGQTLRALGYSGRLVSFEPLPEPFSLLHTAAARDSSWEAVNVALGEAEGDVMMHVSGNSQSSSVSKMLPLHEQAAPSSAYVGQCRVHVTTLSKMVLNHVGIQERLFVKVDAQGHEEQVLAGLGDDLSRVAGLQLELSLVPLYEGQPDFHEMVRRLTDAGFSLVSLEPGFWDRRSGRLLQVDGIFLRM